MYAFRWDWIEPDQLAAGRRPEHSSEINELGLNGIRAIISLTETPLTRLLPELESRDIAYHHYPVADFHAPTVPTAQAVSQTISAMQAQGRPVYLHCLAGIGRTGTLLHAHYLYKGRTLKKAADFIRVQRPANRFDALTTLQQDFLLSLERELQDSTS